MSISTLEHLAVFAIAAAPAIAVLIIIWVER